MQLNVNSFADAVMDSIIHPKHQLPIISQKNDGILVKVEKLKSSDYPELQCWYNCKEHTKEHKGSIVFGWAIFYDSGMYQAQHHAVWQSPDGVLLDVTPDTDASISEILFLPDGRVPYDYLNRRFPVSCYYDPTSETLEWCIKDSSLENLTPPKDYCYYVAH